MTIIGTKQNELTNINYLKAQRQTYSQIKTWMSISFIVGVVVPLIIAIYAFDLESTHFLVKPNWLDKDTIVYLTSGFGLISTIIIESLGNHTKTLREDAAKIQELFDSSVFDLPWDEYNIGEKPNYNFIYDKIESYNKSLFKSKLNDWYTNKAANYTYPLSILLCQRQNTNWDADVRKKFIIWIKVIVVIIVVLVVAFAFTLNMSFRDFFGKIIPISVPVIVFYWKMISEHNETFTENSRLIALNNNVFNEIKVQPSNNDLILKRSRDIQTAIYNYRKSARPIPDLFHKLMKNNQEKKSDAMIEYFLNQEI